MVGCIEYCISFKCEINTCTRSTLSTMKVTFHAYLHPQNDLQEFFSIVEFCNPGILGMYVLYVRPAYCFTEKHIRTCVCVHTYMLSVNVKLSAMYSRAMTYTYVHYLHKWVL